jgi:hypothetical protein
MTEHVGPLQAQPMPHVPYTVDRHLRLRRLEYQLHTLADAIRVLAESPPERNDRTTAETIKKMLDDCNF